MSISTDFINADPFPHTIIDGMWPADLLRQAAAEFDSVPSSGWVRYDSHDEHAKSAYNKAMPPACNLLISLLTSQAATDCCAAMSGIDALLPDPSLYGGGLHKTDTGGFLGLHLDNERHPETGMIRRLNLIIYLTDGWRDDWGGHLEFWERRRTQPATRILPEFGRTVVFETGARSYHGQTQPLNCPAGVSRKSIAVYYWSEPRQRARFLAPACETFDQELEAMRIARSVRQ